MTRFHSPIRAIVAELCRIQGLVGALKHAPGYGYVALPTGPHVQTWAEIVDASIERSRSRMGQSGAFRTESPQKTETRRRALPTYFATVRPVPFPDDMTTKNVYVHEGAFTGIEDVDYVCHGG